MSYEQRGVKIFSFKDLYRIYDKEIWIMLLISGLGAVIICSYLDKEVFRRKIKVYIVTAGKILLNQGDPLRKSTANQPLLRFIALCILFTGIMITNG